MTQPASQRLVTEAAGDTRYATAAQGAKADAAIPASQKGAPNGVASLDSSGTVPSSQLPALALTDVRVVGSQAEMLALTGVDPGDIATRTDGAGTFVLSALPASTLANWVLLNAPTDTVVSVNGRTGTVSLGAVDVGAIDATLLTTKGDLLVRTATGFARVPAGPDGQALVADSTQLLGVKYAPSSGGIPADIALSAPTDVVTDIVIADDGSPTGTWPNRWTWSFQPNGGSAQLVNWINEYGELRITPAKVNTVGFRIFGKTNTGDPAHSGPVFEIQDNRNDRNSMFSVDGVGNVAVAGDVAVTGDVTAPNIGAKVVVIPNGGTVPVGTPPGSVVLELS